MPVDDEFRKPGTVLPSDLSDFATGVHDDHIRSRVLMQGGHEESAPANGAASKFMRFRKFINGRWFHFTVPRAMGPDGYLAHELNFIEKTLERYDIDLHPIDRHLN